MDLKRKQSENGGGWIALLFAIILFLAGLCIFLYPIVSNYIAEKYQATVIQEYEEKLNVSPDTNMEEERQKAEIYNENLAGDPVRDPFVPGSGYALPDNYYEILDIDGIMGYVEIPKINVRLPIYHGTSEEVLEKGVGHIEATSLPIGGEYRHPVLTGHRGLPSAELFTRLDELEIGDTFLIHVLDETLAYKVDQIKTVLPSELDDIRAIRGRDLVTLLTCTPYGVNTHRLLVRGERTEYVPEEADKGTAAKVLDSVFDKRMLIVGSILGLFIFIMLVVLYKILGKTKKKENTGKRRRYRRKRRRRRSDR